MIGSVLFAASVFAQNIVVENQSNQVMYNAHISAVHGDKSSGETSQVQDVAQNKNAQFTLSNQESVLSYRHADKELFLAYDNVPDTYIGLENNHQGSTKLKVTQYHNGQFLGQCEGDGCLKISAEQLSTPSDQSPMTPMIVGGRTDFNSLPPEMKNLAQATVGLIIDKTDGSQMSCTGVAIAPNAILTAAHCLALGHINTLGFSKITIQSNPLSGTKYTLLASDFSDKGRASYHDLVSDDYVVIVAKPDKLRKSHYLKKSNLMLSSDSTSYLIKQKDSNFAYIAGSKEYIIGWSHQRFQWYAVDTTPETNYLNSKVSLHVETNIPTENGDSGAPVFICKVGSSCKLVGIHTVASTRSSGGPSTFFMTSEALPGQKSILSYMPS